MLQGGQPVSSDSSSIVRRIEAMLAGLVAVAGREVSMQEWLRQAQPYVLFDCLYRCVSPWFCHDVAGGQMDVLVGVCVCAELATC
jgi:hypothetical protein